MSCVETYATLRVFSASLSPEVIGDRLGIQASEIRRINPESRYKHERESNFWAWRTDGKIDSNENLLHIGAILDVLKDKAPQLESLRAAGCQIDISNYWVSSGQGGPFLEAATIHTLSSLGLEIWWDVYFRSESET